MSCMPSATEHLVDYQGLADVNPDGFSFPITWDSLTASLAPYEGAPRATRVEPQAVPVQAKIVELIPKISAPSSPPPSEPSSSSPPPRTKDRWEMVVPEMVRTQEKTFAPVIGAPRRVPPPDDSRLLPPPLFASFHKQSLFSRALSIFGKRDSRAEEQSRLPVLARRQAPAPPKPSLSPAELEARRAAREMLLSRIARAVRNPSIHDPGDER